MYRRENYDNYEIPRRENYKKSRKENYDSMKSYYPTFRYLTLVGVILIVAGLGLGTYFFAEYVTDSKKDNLKIGVEEYASVSVIWVGVLAISGLALYEFGPFSKTRSGRNFDVVYYMYKEEPGIFFGSVFVGLLMLMSISLFVYYMYSEEEPLGIAFERSCPVGASLSTNLPHPTEITG